MAERGRDAEGSEDVQRLVRRPADLRQVIEPPAAPFFPALHDDEQLKQPKPQLKQDDVKIVCRVNIAAKLAISAVSLGFSLCMMSQ